MIITLCGSTRFIESFRLYNVHLTLAGHVVFNVATSVKGDWIPTVDEKKTLDLIHLAKIDASDAIFVIDRPFGVTGDKVQTYIGESTQSEMRWASIKRKKIYYASAHHVRQFLFNNELCRADFAEGFDCSNDFKS